MNVGSTAVVLGLVVATLVVAPSGAAAPPSNDDFANATVIPLTGTTFTGASDLTEATVEPGEPGGSSSYTRRTVWYAFAPAADGVVRISRPIIPPDPGPPLLCQLRISRFFVVYRADGAGFAGLTRLADGEITLPVQAGTTYYVQGGDFGDAIAGCADTFHVSVSLMLPPANDDFAHAIPFTQVPFSDSRDLTGATVEPGEPRGCGGNVTQSAWYAFRPTASGSYGSPDPAVNAVNVYTGTSLSDLTVVDCADWFGVFFWAEAGKTYYLQYHGGGMRIAALNPPAADFQYAPQAPTAADVVTFSYWSGGYWDPTVNGWSWDFGDGTTAAGQYVSHRFARDGDYAVTLTVFARGGRSSTRTRTVRVRTPDTVSPILIVPAGVVEEATGPGGATVSYLASATDNLDPSPVVACDRPSGSLFPLGDTTVTCAASDVAGNVGYGSFVVSVRDTTAPMLQVVPGDIAVDATGPQGASARYAASATDVVDPTPMVTCAPPSGAVFPIGDTTVRCTAVDVSGNRATTTFVVHVRGAGEQLANLRAIVSGVGPGTSLADKVAEASEALDAGDAAAAAAIMRAFTRQLSALSGKSIPTDLAAALVDTATRIRAVLA